MNINQISKKYNVNKATIRFWEQEGVMPPVNRDKNGYRDFSEYNEQWIYFIMALRKAGIPIATLKQYTKLLMEGDATISERKAILEAQEQKINEEINTLIQTRDYLHRKINRYTNRLLQYEKKNLYEVQNHPNQNKN